MFSVYDRLPADLSALGGPDDGSIEEGIVQEVDIPTGRVLFEWHSAEHVPPSESYNAVPKESSAPYDYFHINAIEEDRDGTLLVSARHTHAVYKIRRSNGAVLWRLGGKRSDFRFGPDARFSWQHDVRRQPDSTITLFDNAAKQPIRGRQSRAIRLRVDEARHTASLVRSYVRPDAVALAQPGRRPVPRRRARVRRLGLESGLHRVRPGWTRASRRALRIRRR